MKQTYRKLAPARAASPGTGPLLTISLAIGAWMRATVLVLITTTHAAANDTLSALELQQVTVNWANQYGQFGTDGQRIVISASKMDQRLEFTRCQQPLTFEQQQNNARASRTLVKVRCNDEKPWAVYVPLDIQRYQQVVVSRRSLMRDETITADAIELRELSLDRPADHWFSRTDNATGLIVKRNLQAGQPLSQNDVKKPKLVKKGDNVVIVAETGSITVKMMGTALTDGFHNQQIRVKNNSSQRTIKAVVTGAGTVRAIL